MKWLVVLFILMLSINTFAIYVPVVVNPAIYQDNTNYNELSGCKAPIDFAIKNKCTLEKDGKYAVNTYTCGKWVFAATCDGNIYAIKESFYSQNKGIIEIIIFIPIFLVIVTVLLFTFKMQKTEGSAM